MAMTKTLSLRVKDKHAKFLLSQSKEVNYLSKRRWKCHCGSVHDRDINGALNILAFGHERLAVGIPVL